MKIKVRVGTNIVGSQVEDTLEIDDGLTEDQIDTLVLEWAMEQIDFGWRPVE